MRLAWAFMPIVVLAAASAAADPPTAASIAAKKAAVADYLTPKLPAGWSVHVSQDGQALVAYLMIMPLQRAFELAYRPEETSDLVMRLCPDPEQSIWALLGASTRLDLEPMAMGKGFVRLHCVGPGVKPPS